MSKLDRQLDQANAIQPIKIVWRDFEDVDATEIGNRLRMAITGNQSRVPLDCRDVDGAPNELVELLLDANDLAKERGKQVTLAFASDELRHALRPGVHRRAARPSANGGANRSDAASAAANSLHERTASYTNPSAPLPASVAGYSSGRANKPKPSYRLAKLIGAVVVGGAAIGGLEYYLVFNEERTLNITHFVEEQKASPTKAFESRKSKSVAESASEEPGDLSDE